MDYSPLFSPSKARAEASLAADWALATSFLNSVYHPGSPPPFERNEQTLRALLALANCNERANEEQSLLLRAQEQELRDLKKANNASRDDEAMVAEVLEAVEENLTDVGKDALDKLTSLSVDLGVGVDVEDMARALVDRTREEFDGAQQLQRMNTLQQYLEKEVERVQAQLDEFNGPKYALPSEFAEETTEWTRQTKSLDRELVDSKDRLTTLEKSKKPPEITIEQLSVKEKEVLAYDEKVRHLEAQVDAFHGLPADKELAQKEVDKLENELQSVTRHKDELFEKLVEK